MAKLKLTKNEQKKQKDQLRQYERFLPTLQLKKQQLQMVIRQLRTDIDSLREKQVEHQGRLQAWVAVFGENGVFPSNMELSQLLQVEQLQQRHGNIAGVHIPVFEELTFTEVPYNLYHTPLWVDTALEEMRTLARLEAQIKTLGQQIVMLEKELRTTSQRVNLFEKIKIPEAKENIRIIGIYLGDQQTAAVVRGKIAKNKLIATQQEMRR